MRISELSERTGVPIATIKYYIRERLLAPGQRTSRTQADYTDDHVRRLELIRSLRDGAGLSISAVGRTLEALDAPEARRRAQPVETALRALEEERQPGDGDDARAEETAAALVERLGWQVEPRSAGWATLIDALAALDVHWPGTYTLDGLERYARVAEQFAQMEIPDDWSPGTGDQDSLVYAVLGTVLYEPVILALRRLAHVDRHQRSMRRQP